MRCVRRTTYVYGCRFMGICKSRLSSANNTKVNKLDQSNIAENEIYKKNIYFV